MSRLNDLQIIRYQNERTINIEPFDKSHVQPSSYDLCFGDRFMHFEPPFDPKGFHRKFEIDPMKDHSNCLHHVPVQTIGGKNPFVHIFPGEFYLASTKERITLPAHISGEIWGKSSLGRLGLLVHVTAGLVDPGWDGNLTFELSNVTRWPIKIYLGMKAGQITFEEMDGPAKRDYGHRELGSKYHGNILPTASKMHENFISKAEGWDHDDGDNETL